MLARLFIQRYHPTIFLTILLALPLNGKASGNYESLAMLLSSSLLSSFVQQPQSPSLPENPLKLQELAKYSDPAPFGILALIPAEANIYGEAQSKLLPERHTSDNTQNELLTQLIETISEHEQIMPSPTKAQPEIIQLPGSLSLSIVPTPTNTPQQNNQQHEPDKTPPPNEPTEPDPAPDNGNNDSDANQPPGGEEDSSDCTLHNRNVPVALFLNTAGGSDPEDPHDDSTLTTQDPDDKEKAFKELEREVKQHRCNPVKKWLLVAKIIRFAHHNFKYATPCYQLLERLIRWESLVINVLVKLAFNEALAVSAFGNVGQATMRTLAVVTGDTVASLIPWFFPEKTWLEFLSLTAGSTMIASTDNAFSHWTNSSLAMPWLSNDFVNFNIRLIFLINTNVWISKNLYSGLLIGTAAKITHSNLIPLMVFDFIMKPVVLYLGVAVMVGTMPVVCIACAPNPIAPHSFPYPNYCPSVRWVLWQLNCNATNTEQDTIENDCIIYRPLNISDCNCTGVEHPTPMEIEHEL